MTITIDIIIVIIPIIIVIVIVCIVRPEKSAAPYMAHFSEGGMIRLETLIELNSQFELFELILLLKLDKHFPVEQFEATVSQSAVPSPSLNFIHTHRAFRYIVGHVAACKQHGSVCLPTGVQPHAVGVSYPLSCHVSHAEPVAECG